MIYFLQILFAVSLPHTPLFLLVTPPLLTPPFSHSYFSPPPPSFPSPPLRISPKLFNDFSSNLSFQLSSLDLLELSHNFFLGNLSLGRDSKLFISEHSLLNATIAAHSISFGGELVINVGSATTGRVLVAQFGSSSGRFSSVRINSLNSNCAVLDVTEEETPTSLIVVFNFRAQVCATSALRTSLLSFHFLVCFY